MTIDVVPEHKQKFPDTPHAMWVRGELDDFLHLPEGHRAEIIGGKIVVSPAPTIPHGGIIQDISDALTMARASDPDFPWRPLQGADLSFLSAVEGYVPDLVVLDAGLLKEARGAQMSKFSPDQIEMVVEVTSPNGPENDRPPTADRSPQKRITKWTGYARAELPYYLLVDRDPKLARTTLYTIPAQNPSAYLHEETWNFGEMIRLPDPFDIDIDTTDWKPWPDGPTPEEPV
ncbi:Uma2 family endonuclease [Spirillospora sp. CA-294931]|uniref:Uma2 family endonuclease n=1 Tax=Spirillospora sp. CA-294931 TaxID=3240042 RepID=UPI003D8F6910